MDALPRDKKVAGAAAFLKPLAAATVRAISSSTGGDTNNG
jgi:hypothetical protein